MINNDFIGIKETQVSSSDFTCKIIEILIFFYFFNFFLFFFDINFNKNENKVLSLA